MLPLPPPLAYWVDSLDPFLIRFTDRIGVRYYGLAYMAGFLVSAWLLGLYARRGKSRLPGEKVGDLMVAVVAGVIVGGRLGSYFLYDGWRDFTSDPLALFRVWEGGMASHGGMIGVAVGLALYARHQRVSFLHLGDLIASTAPVGLFFGRIANFINGELWGKLSTVRWAVIFPRSAPGVPFSEIPPRHPSQLYEAALEGIVLFAYMQLRFWKSDVTERRPGRLAGEFFLVYAVLRILGEVYREPDSNVTLILGLSRGTFYSVITIAAGLILWAWPAPGSGRGAGHRD